MGDQIVDIINKTKTNRNWVPPTIFDLNNEDQKASFDALISSGKVKSVSDEMEEAIEELFHIEFPQQIDEVNQDEFYRFKAQKLGEATEKYGVWVFYPWSGNLVHFPPIDDLRRLRGSRNRNLITEEERQKLVDNKTIVILGLSVGSNVVDALLMQGIGSKYVLVDLDYLAPTNLNRIRASYDQLGVHKVDVVAKKISELDPFIEQVHYKDGLNESNLTEIVEGINPDIVIDEMDSLKLKIQIRQHARNAKKPVLMATDDGDDILLDIERFDLNSDLPIFHGILPQEVIDKVLSSEKLSRQEMGAIIGRYFVNLENVPVRMLESLMEVGRSLPSWPQLGAAAVLSGLYVAYATKKILLDLPLKDGRFLMGPDQQLNPELETEDYINKKNQIIQMMSGGLQ